MRAFQAAAFGLSRFGAALAALMIVGMTVHILYEIVLRTFFSTSTFVLDEFVGYGVAAATFLGLGYALEHRSLIRVGLVIGRLRGKQRRTLEAICALATIWVVVLLIHYFGATVWRSWSRGRVSSSIAEVPSWIPEGLVLLGMVILLIQLVAYLLRQFTNEPPPVAITTAEDLQNDL